MPGRQCRRMTNVLAALTLLVATASTTEIPLEIGSGEPVLLVRAMVNGRPVLLILDTGATRTILRPELLGKGLPTLAPSRFASNGPGLEARGRFARVTLQLGDRIWPDRNVVTMNFDEVAKAYGAAIDGLLGQDVLGEFARVTIDYRGRRLLLDSSPTR